MKQKAVCIMECWDGPGAKHYQRGHMVEIDPSSDLAKHFRFEEENVPEAQGEERRGPGRPRKEA